MPAIEIKTENEVAWITLNRPEQRNAVNAEMRDELIAAFTDARTNPTIRALVITGSGKGFCTGADLSGPRQGPSGPGAGRELMKSSSQNSLLRATSPTCPRRWLAARRWRS